jgi:hypothetical protein
MRPISITIGIISAALLGLTVWGAFGISHHLIVAVDKWGNSAPGPEFSQTIKDAHQGILDVTAESRDVTIAVLKPCKLGRPETCGLIPAVRMTVQDTGAAVQTMQQQVAQTQPLITAAAQNLNLAGDAVKDTAGHLSKTADAATVAIQTVTIDAKTANDLLVQLRPLIASYTATGNDLDTTIKTANGIMSSQNVTIMLANGAQFTTTAVQLEQKLSQCTLHPTLPCVLKSDILFGAQVSGYLLR